MIRPACAQVASAAAASAVVYFFVVLPLAATSDALGVALVDTARVLATSIFGPVCMGVDAAAVRHRCGVEECVCVGGGGGGA
jgi:hypothetical protein